MLAFAKSCACRALWGSDEGSAVRPPAQASGPQSVSGTGAPFVGLVLAAGWVGRELRVGSRLSQPLLQYGAGGLGLSTCCSLVTGANQPGPHLPGPLP